MFKFKNIFTLAIVSLFAFNTAIASENTSSGSTSMDSKFFIVSAEALDNNTIKVTFSSELDETSVDAGNFLLTKKDDISEISLTGATLSSPKEITLKTETPLDPETKYSFSVAFASDKNGNSIEKGVDSTVDLVFQLGNTSNSTIENASLEGNTSTSTTQDTSLEGSNSENMNSAIENKSEEIVKTTEAPEVTANKPVEEVATTENTTKVETGPTETIAIILALLAGLAFVYLRKKA